jgi:YHS domain-containing protein
MAPAATRIEEPSMNRRLNITFASALFLIATVAAALSPVNKSFLGGVAIDGYDPVAYFTDGKPVEGKKEFSHEWNGATWHFASAEHRDLFAAAPEKYAPQYGGYCAWAVSRGYTADIEPDAWAVVEGKLYLNYDLEVKAMWAKDMPGNIAKGDQNWPKLVGEK